MYFDSGSFFFFFFFKFFFFWAYIDGHQTTCLQKNVKGRYLMYCSEVFKPQLIILESGARGICLRKPELLYHCHGA